MLTRRAERFSLAVVVGLALAGCTAADSEPSPAPVTEGPQLEVTSAGEGRVTIEGAGFHLAGQVIAAQCEPGTIVGSVGRDHCDLPNKTLVEIDEAGRLIAEVPAMGHVAVGERTEYLCVEGATCRIGVVDPNGFAVLAVGDLPPEAVRPLVEAPQLRLSGLRLDAQAPPGRVNVTGEGFPPGVQVKLVQCPAAGVPRGVDTGDCLYDSGVTVTAGEDGTFVTDMAVFPLFQRSSGELIDCVENPDECVIADPWPRGPGARMAIEPFDESS